MDTSPGELAASTKRLFADHLRALARFPQTTDSARAAAIALDLDRSLDSELLPLIAGRVPASSAPLSGDAALAEIERARTGVGTIAVEWAARAARKRVLELSGSLWSFAQAARAFHVEFPLDEARFHAAVAAVGVAWEARRRVERGAALVESALDAWAAVVDASAVERAPRELVARLDAALAEIERAPASDAREAGMRLAAARQPGDDAVVVGALIEVAERLREAAQRDAQLG
ncbi:MAG: hypothetical protein ACYDCK_11285 [Thermoplasmatota archaeon]